MSGGCVLVTSFEVVVWGLMPLFLHRYVLLPGISIGYMSEPSINCPLQF